MSLNDCWSWINYYTIGPGYSSRRSNASERARPVSDVHCPISVTNHGIVPPGFASWKLATPSMPAGLLKTTQHPTLPLDYFHSILKFALLKLRPGFFF